MAVAVKTGTIDTEAVLPDEKKIDMSNEFKMLDQDESQFSTLLDKLPSQSAVREKVNWLEDQYFPNKSSVAAAGYTNVATTLPVATGEGAYFRAGDLVRNVATMEMMLVTAVAGDNLTITRAIGGVVAAQAGTSGQALLIVGNASAQAADIGTLKVTNRVLGYNYTQIFRNPFGFSGTDVEIDTYGTGDPMNEIAKKAVEHKRSLENTFFFGARSFTAASPNSIGTCGGLRDFITTNKTAAVGTLTAANLGTIIRGALQKGSRDKVIFASPLVVSALSALYTKTWAPNEAGGGMDATLGIRVSGYVSGSFGDRIPVVLKREWGNFGDTTEIGSLLVVLDRRFIKKRPLRGRGTSLLRNRQGNGEDRVVHEYLTETSLEMSVESAHAWAYGIVSP